MDHILKGDVIVNSIPSSSPEIPKRVIDRFWSKVNKTETCWEWTAGLFHPNGYGQFCAKEIPHIRTAHRFSWFLHNGTIPTGMFVCHHCDNPKCVRPSHLFLGTNSDNMKDCYRKGRMKNPCACGEKHPMSKFTTSQIIEIRRAYKAGEYTIRGLSVLYSCSYPTMAAIVKYESWKSIK